MTIDVILRESRYLTNKSQEYMALELGVARKTIRNWENGISAPDANQAIEWFRILGVSPLPYFLQLLFPDMEKPNSDVDEAKLRKALITLIENLPMEGVRELLFLFYGEHGSSPRAVLNMLTAHLHTPMRDRVMVGSIVAKNYSIAEKKGQLVTEEQIKPDMEFLYEAVRRGEEAYLKDKNGYMM